MVVHIAQCPLVNEVVAAQRTVVGRVSGCVERHKYVGHNATATIHGTPLYQGFVHLGRVKVYAVNASQLTTGVALFKILVVLTLLTLGVGLLNAAARGCVIVRHGEAYHRTVGQVDGTLYESLAKGATANDGATVVILYGTTHNLGCRGGKLVNEYNHAATRLHQSVTL